MQGVTRAATLALIASVPACDAIIGFPAVPDVSDAGSSTAKDSGHVGHVADTGARDATHHDAHATDATPRDASLDVLRDGAADALLDGAAHDAPVVPIACSPTCAENATCRSGTDCASHVCSNGVCTDATSCLTLQQQLMSTGTASPASGTYEIDPDGAGVGAPFDVYCDMATDGGGWTFLPLRWSDPAFWSITSPGGNSCVDYDVRDNLGNFGQYQSSSNATAWSNTAFAFVPPIPVSTVMLVSFTYTNTGRLNGMDFVVGAEPTGTETSLEGWFFATPAFAPLAYVFPTAASCVSPYTYAAASMYCTRDGQDVMDSGIPTADLTLSGTYPLTSIAPGFVMEVMQGCNSGLEVPPTAGEQFDVATPPSASGVWTTGIAIR